MKNKITNETVVISLSGKNLPLWKRFRDAFKLIFGGTVIFLGTVNQISNEQKGKK